MKTVTAPVDNALAGLQAVVNTSITGSGARTGQRAAEKGGN